MNQDDTATVASPTGSKARPDKVLPTDRISFQNQVNLLLAYAAMYDQTGKPVSNEEAGRVAGLSANTTSLGNAFFSDVGFLTRAEGGYIPSAAVMDFQKVYEWEPAEAGEELAPLLRAMWFAEAILPRLALGPMSEQVALRELSKQAGAGKQYQAQLRTILDYLDFAGLVTHDGDQFRRPQGAPSRDKPDADPEEDPPKPRDHRDRQRHIPDLHPFVEGLLRELPPAGSEWSTEDQKAWLEGWEVAFRFLYKPGSAPRGPRHASASHKGGETD